MITLRQNSFNAGEFSPELWHTPELKKWTSACRRMENFLPRVRGSAENRSGTHFIYPQKDSTMRGRLYPFQFSVTQWYILCFEQGVIRFFKDDGVIVDGGNEVEIATPYQESELSLLKFEQSADVLYIHHPSYVTKKLTRTSHVLWTLTDIVNGSTLVAPTSFARSAGAATGFIYGVTAVDASELESVLSNSVAGGRGDTFTWTASAGASYYNFYEQSNGSWAFIGKSIHPTVTYTVLAAPTRDQGKTPKEAYTPFVGANNFPGCGAFFEQRRYSARTNAKPQTIFGSVVGDFDNFNRSIPALDDDSVEFTLNARSVNEIRWLAGLDDLIIGTSDSEWRMRAGQNSTAITPASVDLKLQSSWGCSHLPPWIIGESLVFVDGSKRRVRDLGYSLEKDGYTGNDLNVLAEHLFESSKVYEWAHQKYPDSTLWCVREDGVLCGLTYLREHEIWGWHRHVTDGFFESVASVVTNDGESTTWVIVRRTVANQTVRYIERLDTREFETIEDAFFVDCGLSYDGAPADTFSGFEHLEGREVIALADGNVVRGLQVIGGVVEFNREYSKVHIGLPYECYLDPIGFDYSDQSGVAASKRRQITSMVVSLRNTRELQFASAPGYNYRETKFRELEDYDQSTRLFNGEKELFVDPSGIRDARVAFRTVNPLPCTIEAVTVNIQGGQM